MSISSQLGKSFGRQETERVNGIRPRRTMQSVLPTTAAGYVVQLAIVGFCGTISARDVAHDEVSERVRPWNSRTLDSVSSVLS